MPDSALPENLKGKKHKDWIFPFNLIPRGWTAFKWRMPPILLIGYNVKTWETADAGDHGTVIYPFGKGWVCWKNRIGVQGTKKYGPATIQKILGQWTGSFHISYPLGIHFTIKLWKKKKPSKDDLERGIAQGYDQTIIIYGRFGARWDSYDSYYQFPGIFFGFTYN